MDEHLKPEEVEQRLAELEAALTGHFQLSSGRHSDRYFQCAKVLQYPGLASELGRLLAEQFNELEIDCVLSPAVGGVLVGHELARGLGRRHLFAERKGGQKGTGFQLRRGFELQKGERVLVADDVLTRGTSFHEMADMVREHEAEVVGLGVIVDRREPDVQLDLPVASLMQAEVKSYEPDDCPLCREGVELASPGSRHGGR